MPPPHPIHFFCVYSVSEQQLEGAWPTRVCTGLTNNKLQGEAETTKSTPASLGLKCRATPGLKCRATPTVREGAQEGDLTQALRG